MREIPPIRQSVTRSNLLRLVAPSVVLGLLLVVFMPLPRASALSLSLGATVHLPLLPPVGITSNVSLLEPHSLVKLNIAAGQTPANAGSTPQPIGASVVIPSVFPPTDTIAPPPAPVPISPATQADPKTSSVATRTSGTKTTDKKTVAVATSDAPRQQNFLGFNFPNGFGLLPEAIGGNNSSFRVALILLTSMAVLFLGLATITTAKLTRGSPHVP